MHPFFKVSMLAVVVAIAAGCDKPTIDGAPKPAATEQSAAKQEAGTAFTRDGELLTISVSGMERAQFVQELQKLTGTRIELRAGQAGKVDVDIKQASLRAVLAAAFKEAPYSINMQFNNVQDSFPAVVLVNPHGAPAPMVRGPQSVLGNPAELAKTQAAQADDNTPEEPDFDELPTPEAKLDYFFTQDTESQSSIVFELDADEDSQLLNAMFNDPRTARGIKVEILDNLSFGEYDSASKTINDALASDEPAVQAKALSVLGELGTEDDLETAKKYTSGDYPASVREAAQEAVEFLSP